MEKVFLALLYLEVQSIHSLKYLYEETHGKKNPNSTNRVITGWVRMQGFLTGR